MRKLLIAMGAISCFAMLVVACGGGGDDAKKTAAPASSTSGPVATPTVGVVDASAILEANKNTVVKIVTTTGQAGFTGSGIVWEDASHVLTNAHVVIGAGAIKVLDPNDSTKSFPAKVVGLSACDDLALLSIDRGQHLQPIKVGDSDATKAGDHIVALGFPATISSGPTTPIVTEGNVSRVHATFDFGGQRDLIQHTSAINPGNSGGPLFNLHGEVIGINSYSARNTQSENYAISINEAKTVVAELKGGKNVDYLGMTLEPNDKDFANQNGFAYIDGLAVVAVDPGSAASAAKPYPFQFGDLIFEVNGTSVATVGDFCDILRSHNSGQTLDILYGAYDANQKPYNNFEATLVIP